jgi:AraC family transcriptional regulator
MSETSRSTEEATPASEPDDDTPVPVEAVDRHLSSTPVLSSGSDWPGITVQVHDGFVFPQRRAVPQLSDHGVYVHLEHPAQVERWMESTAGDRRQAEAGDLTIVPAQTDTEWRWDRPIRIMHLYLDPRLLERAAEQAADVDPGRVELIPRLSEADPLVAQIGKSLVGELQDGTAMGRLYAEEAAEMLAVHLLRHHCSVETEVEDFTGGIPPARLKRVRDYVEANLDGEIRLDDLAAQAEMSKYHFSRQFKKEVGQSPTQFVIDQRIEKGKRLLEETDWLIARISLEVGYQSQSRFTTQFKRRVGTTPGRYRKA